tara:strand:+ start:108 stop:392 length:285 start_codon:yes stop_codon:yes gene_type:complete
MPSLKVETCHYPKAGKNKQMKKEVEVKPSWEGAARMCILLLGQSSPKANEFAKEELIKMGKELDKAEKVLTKINASISKVEPIVGIDKRTAAMN